MRTGHSRLLAAGIGRGAGGRHLRTVSLAGPSGLTNVGSANPKVVGVNYPNVLSPQLDEVIAAQGSTRLENPGPAGPGDSGIPYYGYDGDGPMMPVLDSKTFFFDETGDTSSLTEAAPDWGGFGEIQKLTQDPEERQRHPDAVLQGRRRAHRARQHVLPDEERDRLRRGRR